MPNNSHQEYLDPDLNPRDSIDGFSERTLKNLQCILDAHDAGDDVHPTTQLVNSLLGLLIFPLAYRKQKSSGSLDFTRAELQSCGWDFRAVPLSSSPEPAGRHAQRGSANPTDIDHIRNALAHRRIRFNSDSRNLQEIKIEFWDRPHETARNNWSGVISGDALKSFVVRLAEQLQSHDWK